MGLLQDNQSSTQASSQGTDDEQQLSLISSRDSVRLSFSSLQLEIILFLLSKSQILNFMINAYTKEVKIMMVKI